MAATLRDQFLQQLATGLVRRSVKKCSDWAMKYRIMGQPYPGKFTFVHHPWLRAMHDSEAEFNVGQKAAQMGYTETMLNLALFHVDIHQTSVLYVLPSAHPDASNFSADRFGLALELSPYLKDLFSQVSNVGHKRSGNANLYIRGSRSRSQLKSIATGLVILDEKDEMTPKNVPLAYERTAGQVNKLIWQISTPSIPGYGINADFEESTQNHFFFKCPHCSRYTELIFPDSFVMTADSLHDPNLKNSYTQCKECKTKLDHAAKTAYLADNQWVPTYRDRRWTGWYINQLYSPTIKPEDIARSMILADSDPGHEQELYNSKMGLPRVVKGAGVTDADIIACLKEYSQYEAHYGNRVVTAGIDVGKKFHYVIEEWILPPAGSAIVDINSSSRPRLLKAGECLNLKEVEDDLANFRVNFAVIDSQPERRLAIEFANRHYGKIRACSYEMGIEGKTLHLDAIEPRVKVDRTSWLDLSLGRFKAQTIDLPKDTPEEFKSHIKAQVRVYTPDAFGNPTGRWVTPDKKHDHWGHARNYSEIALPLATSQGSIVDMSSPI